MNHGQVTMLDQLPDLETLEGGHIHGNAGLPPGMGQQYAKMIRGNHRTMPESGMMNSEYYNSMGQYGMPVNSRYATLDGPMMEMEGYVQPENPEPVEQNRQIPQQQHNCIDIANHVNSCPICSKFYNNDRTVYIIAIVVLSIICLLLLKRLLDV